jgi:putative transposase
MPRKPKSEKLPGEVLAPIPADILDQIVRDGPLTAAEVETATRRFKKALIECALGAELSHHLGYAAGTQTRAQHESSERDERQDGADR